jgi:UDP-glucuronate 4-epimerase
VILVTGAAGFIGYHVARRLLDRGEQILGIDNLNNYYDVSLKQARLAQLTSHKQFTFVKADVADREALSSALSSYSIRSVVHLAAQAGIRYSLLNPSAYVDANIAGFLHVLEHCRNAKVQHLVFASSSSVYGGNTKMPFSVHDNVDHPVSLYAATKKANELMAHAYALLYDIPCTGLRFFTVYGPWGRPDMALFLFTQAILEGRPIDVFNFGDMRRDFTYIDDIAEGVVRVLDKPAAPNPHWSGQDPDPGTSSAPYRVYNIGNHRPVELSYLISLLEQALGKTAEKNFLPMQPGDVPATYAEIDYLIREVGFKPDTSIEVGIQQFVDWYRAYYQPN